MLKTKNKSDNELSLVKKLSRNDFGGESRRNEDDVDDDDDDEEERFRDHPTPTLRPLVAFAQVDLASLILSLTIPSLALQHCVLLSLSQSLSHFEYLSHNFSFDLSLPLPLFPSAL